MDVTKQGVIDQLMVRKPLILLIIIFILPSEQFHFLIIHHLLILSD